MTWNQFTGCQVPAQSVTGADGSAVWLFEWAQVDAAVWAYAARLEADALMRCLKVVPLVSV